MADKAGTIVLMTADTVGGVWTYAVSLIRSLSQEGIHFHLATMGAPLTASQRKEVSDLQHLTLHESDYKLEWMPQPWADVDAAGEWLIEIAKEINPDLVHLNNLVHGDLDWKAPVVNVVHSCVLSWWQAVKMESAPAEWNAYRNRVMGSLRQADAVVAPSQCMLNEATRLYGPFRTAKAIYNGVDPEVYSQMDKQPMVFSMGRMWDEAKNLKLLTEAATEINLPISIAGDGNHPATGEPAASEGISMLGRLSQQEAQQWLQKASIYAAPARYEPFGLAVLEAASAGCALVLGNIPSLNEIWGDAAIYIDPDDSASLIEAINKLADDWEVLLEYQARATKKAKEYPLHRKARAYKELYDNLLKETNRKNSTNENKAVLPLAAV